MQQVSFTHLTDSFFEDLCGYKFVSDLFILVNLNLVFDYRPFEFIFHFGTFRCLIGKHFSSLPLSQSQQFTLSIQIIPLLRFYYKNRTSSPQERLVEFSPKPFYSPVLNLILSTSPYPSLFPPSIIESCLFLFFSHFYNLNFLLSETVQKFVSPLLVMVLCLIFMSCFFLSTSFRGLLVQLLSPFITHPTVYLFHPSSQRGRDSKETGVDNVIKIESRRSQLMNLGMKNGGWSSYKDMKCKPQQ